MAIGQMRSRAGYARTKKKGPGGKPDPLTLTLSPKGEREWIGAV